MSKITKRVIDSLKPPATGSLFVWDSELRGYGVRVSPQGRVAFLVQYRTPQGRTRRYSFAVYGPCTADQARSQARRLPAAARPVTIRQQLGMRNGVRSPWPRCATAICKPFARDRS